MFSWFWIGSFFVASLLWWKTELFQSIFIYFTASGFICLQTLPTIFAFFCLFLQKARCLQVWQNCTHVFAKKIFLHSFPFTVCAFCQNSLHQRKIKQKFLQKWTGRHCGESSPPKKLDGEIHIGQMCMSTKKFAKIGHLFAEQNFWLLVWKISQYVQKNFPSCAKNWPVVQRIVVLAENSCTNSLDCVVYSVQTSVSDFAITNHFQIKNIGDKFWEFIHKFNLE